MVVVLGGGEMEAVTTGFGFELQLRLRLREWSWLRLELGLRLRLRFESELEGRYVLDTCTHRLVTTPQNESSLSAGP